MTAGAPGTEVLATIADYRATALSPHQPLTGVSYDAVDPQNRRVSLHVVAAAAPADAARFLADARKLQGLEGRGVEQVLDVGEAPEGSYVASAPVPGASLEELVASGGGLAPMRAVRLLGDVADGLDAAHRESLLHRSVRPSTIFVQDRPTERARLAGFALGLPHEQTPPDDEQAPYVSPEEVAGEPATPASDIYSLACVLYEALAGAPPFLGQSPAEVRQARLEQDPPMPSSIRPGLSPALDAALIQGLRRRPEDRPATADALVRAAARSVLDMGDLGAQPPAPVRPAVLPPPPPPPAAAAPVEPAPPPPPVEPPPAERSPLPPWAKPFPDPEPEPEPPAPEPVAALVPAPAPAPVPEAAAPPKPEPEPVAASTALAPIAVPAEPPTPRRPVSRRAFGATFPLLLAVLLVAAAVAAGWLTGHKSDKPARAGLSSPAVALTPPVGWTSSAAAPVGGLRLRDAVGASGSGGELVSGSAGGVLPERFAGRVADHPGRPATVRLGDLDAYRWTGVRERRSRERVTLFALPSSAGVAVLACLGPAVAQDACAQSAGSFKPAGATPGALSGLEAWSSNVDRIIARLNRGRAGGRQALRRARSGRAQGRAAARLRRAHEAAAKSLGAAPPAPAAQAQAAMVKALKRIGASYRDLGRAARRGRSRDYVSARAAVRRHERELGAALREL